MGCWVRYGNTAIVTNKSQQNMYSSVTGNMEYVSEIVLFCLFYGCLFHVRQESEWKENGTVTHSQHTAYFLICVSRLFTCVFIWRVPSKSFILKFEIIILCGTKCIRMAGFLWEIFPVCIVCVHMKLNLTCFTVSPKWLKQNMGR